MNYSLQELDTLKLRASYFLHHPDLSSRMIAADAPIAEFEQLNIEVRLQVEETPDSPAIMVRNFMQEGGGGGAQSSHRYGLRCNPRLTRKALVAQEDTEPVANESTTRKNLYSDTTGTTEADVLLLLDTALRRLIGARGLSSRCRTQGSRGYIPLIDIAPAVWNLHYLQVSRMSDVAKSADRTQSMAVHTQTIPAIASGIARLAKARSITLRVKLLQLSSLEGAMDKGAVIGTDTDGIRDEVKRRLWSLCQTTIREDPISRAAPQKTKSLVLTDPAHQSNAHLGDVDPGDVEEIERSQYMEDDEAAKCLQDHTSSNIWAVEHEEKPDDNENLPWESDREPPGEGFDESELGSEDSSFFVEDSYYEDEDADGHPHGGTLLITPLEEFEQQPGEDEQFFPPAALSPLTDVDDLPYPIDGAATIAEFAELFSDEEYMTARCDAASGYGLGETAEYLYVDDDGDMHLLCPKELEQESY